MLFLIIALLIVIGLICVMAHNAGFFLMIAFLIFIAVGLGVMSSIGGD